MAAGQEGLAVTGPRRASRANRRVLILMHLPSPRRQSITERYGRRAPDGAGKGPGPLPPGLSKEAVLQVLTCLQGTSVFTNKILWWPKSSATGTSNYLIPEVKEVADAVGWYESCSRITQ
ncbi:hypothetical protein SKAU_G00078880 [Synaphobranchus kaupii]|uniref:Uncharacterized protein n=1 Tax=Synaphobranchus kaupii TaxID=118154 RepID=A0A9Q1J341_SYNKA|nr:hypothetical protein SKAU_G00078880 [Synaphobranchus kaupii]